MIIMARSVAQPSQGPDQLRMKTDWHKLDPLSHCPHGDDYFKFFGPPSHFYWDPLTLSKARNKYLFSLWEGATNPRHWLAGLGPIPSIHTKYDSRGSFWNCLKFSLAVEVQFIFFHNYIKLLGGTWNIIWQAATRMRPPRQLHMSDKTQGPCVYLPAAMLPYFTLHALS